MAEAHPLQWPDGWPRTPHARMRDGRGDFGRFEQQDGRSYRSKRPLTFAEARDSLIAAAKKIGAEHIVLSSNFALRSDGLPRHDRRRPDDQGAAIYFKRGDRQLVMARDAYQRAEENMRSIALALEAMAQLERHGGGVMMDKAFAGFTALPPPAGSAPARPWRNVFQFDPDFPGALRSAEAVSILTTRFRDQAATAHPDRGGSAEAMAELNAARDAALKELKL